jgi:curved DNA-binding protein CbpA
MQYDFYKILGVGYQASAEEIKHAFYEKAKKYHPDVSKEEGADQIFKVLNEAYQTLINPQKRKKYDFRLHYGSMIQFSSRAEQERNQRSARYEEYIRHRRAEEEEAARTGKGLFKVLNGFLFWSMAAFLAAGLVFSIIDAIMNYDFLMLVFILHFVLLAVLSAWYIMRRNKASK